MNWGEIIQDNSLDGRPCRDDSLSDISLCLKTGVSLVRVCLTYCVTLKNLSMYFKYINTSFPEYIGSCRLICDFSLEQRKTPQNIVDSTESMPKYPTTFSLHTHTHTNMYIYIYVCVRVCCCCVCVCVCMCVCVLHFVPPKPTK